MKLKCKACGRDFFWEMKYIAMISESVKRNPKLKILCSKCGLLIMLKHEKEKLGKTRP